MIEGLKIDVSYDELQAHLMKRGNYHKERAEWYTDQAQLLEESGLESKTVSLDPVSSIKKKRQDHEDKAGFFFFLAEHLVEGERYRLSDHDFSRLEFYSSYF